MEKVINKDEYLEHLLRDVSPDNRLNVLKEAYKNALDTRKFEIELYWKRAAYFWAFIASLFLALYTLVNKNYDFPDLNSFNQPRYIVYLFLILAVSILGYLFSLGWFFVNRGSKIWQKNWEVHIDLLEEYINGPLFKTVIKPNLNFWSTNSYYPYSVSKVNQILSMYVCIFWILLINLFVIILVTPNYDICCVFLSIILVNTFLFTLGYLFHKQTVSFMYKDLKGKSKYKYTYINID